MKEPSCLVSPSLVWENCYHFLEENPSGDYVNEAEELFTIDLVVEDCDCGAEDVVMMFNVDCG